LCIDLVLNHTAKEHAWAKKAAKGDARYQDYYLMFDTPEMPNRYSETLVEVFPDNAPGNFQTAIPKRWSKSFPTTHPATSPIIPILGNGSGPRSMNINGI